MFKEKNIENLQFAVYGGICVVLGLLSIIISVFSNFDCKSDIVYIIGLNLISSVLGFLSIFFSFKAIRHIQGKSVITLGFIVIIAAWLLYFLGITCN